MAQLWLHDVRGMMVQMLDGIRGVGVVHLWLEGMAVGAGCESLQDSSLALMQTGAVDTACGYRGQDVGCPAQVVIWSIMPGRGYFRFMLPQVIVMKPQVTNWFVLGCICAPPGHSRAP